MPKPKIEALLKAPPSKLSNIPSTPSDLPGNLFGLMPGSTTKEPNRNITKNNSVFKILLLKSSIEKMFLIVVINFFIN
jgi:hypothetical protein